MRQTLLLHDGSDSVNRMIRHGLLPGSSGVMQLDVINVTLFFSAKRLIKNAPSPPSVTFPLRHCVFGLTNSIVKPSTLPPSGFETFPPMDGSVSCPTFLFDLSHSIWYSPTFAGRISLGSIFSVPAKTAAPLATTVKGSILKSNGIPNTLLSRSRKYGALVGPPTRISFSTADRERFFSLRTFLQISVERRMNGSATAITSRWLSVISSQSTSFPEASSNTHR